jgi:hypothetical protein
MPERGHVNVRFGSLAAGAWSNRNVRFTPESCRGFRRPARPLVGVPADCDPPASLALRRAIH